MPFSKSILTAVTYCSLWALATHSAYAQTSSQQTTRPIVYPSVSITTFDAIPLNEVLLSADVIDGKDIEQSTATTLSDLIAKKTGIELSRTGGRGSVTSHFLRGQKSANYVLLIDGIRVHGDTYGNVIMPELSVHQIEKIEVLKGNASALYGEAAIGGVINIITKSASLRDSGFLSASYGNYNTAETSAGISKYLGGVNVSFVGTKFETEGFDARSDTGTNADKDGYSQDSYNVTLAKRVSADGHVTIGLRHRKSEMDYDDTYPSAGFANRVHEASTKNQEQFITYELERDALINLRFDYNVAMRTRKDFIDGAPASTLVSWKNDVIEGHTKTAKLVNISHLESQNVQHTLTQGIERIDAYFDSDGSRSERDTNALFAGYLGRKEAHSVQANLRRDKVSLKTTGGTEADMQETSYLIGYGYRFADGYKIALSHATGFRAPDAGAYASNTSLKPETYRSNEVSLQRDKEGRLLRFTFFSTDTNNEIEYLTVSPWTPENIAKTKNQGLEISYSGQTNMFDYDLDLTFQDPKEKESSSGSKLLLKRAKTFGKLALSKEISGMVIGSNVTYSGRKKDVSNTEIASFIRVDGFISRELRQGLTLKLEAENITNAEYETSRGYRTPERSLFLSLKYDFFSGL